MDVDVARLQDWRIAAVASRDPDDAPTAALSALLGVQGLSEDTDLCIPGLATGPAWLEVIVAPKDVALGELVDFGLTLGCSVTTRGIGEATKHLAGLARILASRRSLLVAAGLVAMPLGVVALVFLLSGSARRWTSRKVEPIWGTTELAVAAAGGAYVRVTVSRYRGMLRLEAAAVAAVSHVVAAAAQVLATARTPMSSKQLAREVWGYKRVPVRAVNEMEVILQSWCLFVETPDAGWQLGRSRG